MTGAKPASYRQSRSKNPYEHQPTFLPQESRLVQCRDAFVPRARLFSGDTAAFEFDPSENLLRAPRDPAQWPAFRQKLAQWRDENPALVEL